MEKKLSPILINLIQDACIKVFWYKRDLANFLRLNQISNADIIRLQEKEMTKTEFLGQLFYSLINKKDLEGHRIIYEIGANLCEMTSFPYLETKEELKSKIPIAQKAINDLKPHINNIKNFTNDDLRRQKNIKEGQIAKEKRTQFLNSLNILKDELTLMASSSIGTQKGGYDFERWLNKLFCLFDIETKSAYREPSGRQIDMAFTLDGLHYIVEAKFTLKQVAVTDVDSFNAKIKKMADGTKGLMISISGYSNGAVKAASSDRTWILMMDYSHLFNLILNDRMTLNNVIHCILSNASQTGESFLPVQDF